MCNAECASGRADLTKCKTAVQQQLGERSGKVGTKQPCSHEGHCRRAHDIAVDVA